MIKYGEFITPEEYMELRKMVGWVEFPIEQARACTLPIYVEYVEGGRKEREEDRRIYFDKNPSFEEWCDDVFFYIKHDRWYMRNMPDYSRKEFDEALEDKFVRRDMENHFNNREMPLQTAGVWDLITF